MLSGGTQRRFLSCFFGKEYNTFPRLGTRTHIRQQSGAIPMYHDGLNFNYNCFKITLTYHSCNELIEQKPLARNYKISI